jgi:hypothetical protein
MAEQNDIYAIVLIGGMNPRIHHPSWYRLVNLFGDEEAEQGIRTPSTFITPLMSQIQTPKLTIACQDNRWEIRTSDPGQVQRIQDITSMLFDEILPHTPLMAAGFNFTYRKATAASDVGLYVATVLSRAPLGLKADHAMSGEVILRRSFNEHTALVNVQPVADEKQAALISHNFEYQFKDEGFFKLGEIIARRYGADKSESEEQTALIVDAIDRWARE